MWLMRTALKVLFPGNGRKASTRHIITTTDNATVSRPTREPFRKAMNAPPYVECRVQHTTAASVEACRFHSRPENTPQWLRVERFAKTWSRPSDAARLSLRKRS